MELNTRGRYAVMAMADIAKYGPKTGAAGSVPLSAIAERQHVSLAYLEQLFQRLRRAGLVDSVRGRSGGYVLARAPQDVAITQIMAAVEEPVKMTRCEGGEIGCVGEQRCLTHDLWTALGEQIETFLSGVSLKDVVEGLPGRVQPCALPAKPVEQWTREFGLTAK